MARRSRAREVPLQLLYESDRTPDVLADLDAGFVCKRLRTTDLQQFASQLVHGVRAHRADLDALIQQSAHPWTVDRLSPIDRCILRLGTYEIVVADETPPK